MLSPLYSRAAIEERVKGIAEAINRDFAGEEMIHAVVVMNGAFVFAADLVRHIKVPITLHFAGETATFATEGPKSGRIQDDALPASFNGQAVVLIEDVIDSAKTVSKLREMVASRFAGSIMVAALLKRQGGGQADYFGFTIPQGLFVVGYGMDLDGKYRQLPDLQSVAAASSSERRGLC